MIKNTIQIGKDFEDRAVKILMEEGFNILEHTSKNNWQSTYDLIIEKQGIKYYVEIRGRNGINWSLGKKKIDLLKNLNGEVLIFCLNKEIHFFFNLKDISENESPIVINGNKFYVINSKMKEEGVLATITCMSCDETFTGLTIKQAERYKQMHKCKGDKDE